MRSDQRLHPLSILFALGGQIRSFAVPGLLVLFSAGSTGWSWELWAMPLLVPFALVSVFRYFTFRYRYEASEMVIRTGLLFRNERHVPYARIQNIDGVQNLLHRLLGVVEVRVETGGGNEPEAKMSVLPVAAFEEMRRRVFGDSGGARSAAPVAADSTAISAAPDRTLLHLPPRELLLCGLIQNRGAVVIGAAFGLLWELGLMEGLVDRIFGEQATGRGVVRDLFRAAFGLGRLPLNRIALTLVAFVGFLLLLRVVSMGWTIVRLHGFRLSRLGEDLRTEFGLLTRVTATIPLRRIQTLTIRESPLHQLFRRVSAKVETAGGKGGEDTRTQREWLAPILRRDQLPGLVHEVIPELDFAAIAWRAADPRAFKRELRGGIVVAVAICLPFVMILKWWDLALLALLVAWAFIGARLYVKHLGWAVTDGAVLLRTGWAWRQLTVARFAKIQAVAIHESPFDRRHAMARVRVDTAGAGEISHRVDIPYLPRETARELCDLLAARAAETAFRW